MKTGTSSSSLQLEKAAQLWHKVIQLQQEVAPQSHEATNAQEVKRAVQIVRSDPEISAERIADLRAQIMSGTYQIDNEALTQKMLGIISLQEWNLHGQE